MEEEESPPREFYEPVVLMKDAFAEWGVSDDAIEQALDQIEAIIAATLDEVESGSSEGSQDDEPSK
jgi:hypothetical protein